MIGPESDEYKLRVSGYSGNAGDPLEYHNGKTFITKDRDNERKCSTKYKGGWWYDACYRANLNGLYNVTNEAGVIWRYWKRYNYSLRFVEMKFREIN